MAIVTAITALFILESGFRNKTEIKEDYSDKNIVTPTR